ncbi:MAG: hypothetical protein JEZ03_11630 [Bacteroidales bacterium]|nr:hypothetical protein [Bacteroidales bacterium]
MVTVILHIQNEDPVVGELDEIPPLDSNMVLVKNPRLRDGKDLPYLDPEITLVLWPLWKINFIEIAPSGDKEDIISFVRE